MAETVLKKYKRPGRPKRPGSIAFDKRTGSLRVFIGYCEHGDPVMIERDDIDPLVRWARKEKKKLSIRILHWIMHSRML